MDNGKKSLFLDTTTQIARHWHSKETQDETKGQLYGRKLYCSRYIKCQYKGTLLNSIIYLHNLLLKSDDLQQAQQKATEGRFSKEACGRLTPGVLSRIVDIAYWISRWYKTYEEQVDGLRDLIEDAWETLFHYRIELPLVDETGCMYAEGHPKMGVSGAYEPINISCAQKDPPECRIKKFWENHRAKLDVLEDMDVDSIETTPKDTKGLNEVKEYAGRIRENNSPHGKTCTFYLSDAIICLESEHCPEPANVHSTNKKHFGPLCEVLELICEPLDR
jgi:hypothetical protein